MPSRRSRIARPQVDSSRTKGDARRHFEALGLQSEQEYRRWCKQHGFGQGLLKSGTQKRRELDVARGEQQRSMMSRRRSHTRRPDVTFSQLHDGSIGDGPLGADYFELARTCFQRLEDDAVARRTFRDLLIVASARGKLMGLDPALPHLGSIPSNRSIEGLARLARHHAAFVREPDEWRPDSRNPRRQFGHLARHLLARYEDVPAFMDAAWLDESDETAKHEGWFLHLGNGGNIRTAADLPVAFTKRMAHHFVLAPADLSITAAVRWAQVCGQDGSETLARAVIESRLGASFEHEDFWSTVVQFFVRNPMLDPAHVGPIVDYIQAQKYEPALGTALLGLYFILPESNVWRTAFAFRPSRLIMVYGRIFFTRDFFGPVMCAGCIFGGLMLYVVAAPFLIIDEMGYSVRQFSLTQAAVVLGYIGGLLITSRLISRVGPKPLLFVGLITITVGGVLMLALALAGLGGFRAFVLPCAVYTLGIGLAMAPMLTRALSVNPAATGSVAALLGTVTMGFAFLGSRLAIWIYDGTTLPVAAAVAGVSVLALLVYTVTYWGYTSPR